MSRRRAQKRKSKILELKIVFEEREIAEEEQSIGTLELKEILKDFSKRVKKDQKSSFDQFFFGSTDDTKQKNTQVSNSTDIVLCEESESNVISKDHSPSGPKWVKDLYKKIVQRSHPDKYIGFPIEEIKEKFTRIYINAVQAFEDMDIGMLLLCAHDVEIDIDNISESNQYISTSIVTHKVRIEEITKLIGYQWYHLVDKNRMQFLENYLRQLGYSFDVHQVRSAVEKTRVKRKPGTRPEKIKRVNKKRIE